jgi:hypothetical protein
MFAALALGTLGVLAVGYGAVVVLFTLRAVFEVARTSFRGGRSVPASPETSSPNPLL